MGYKSWWYSPSWSKHSLILLWNPAVNLTLCISGYNSLEARDDNYSLRYLWWLQRREWGSIPVCKLSRPPRREFALKFFPGALMDERSPADILVRPWRWYWGYPLILFCRSQTLCLRMCWLEMFASWVIHRWVGLLFARVSARTSRSHVPQMSML